jgi:hypothetical protein
MTWHARLGTSYPRFGTLIPHITRNIEALEYLDCLINVRWAISSARSLGAHEVGILSENVPSNADAEIYSTLRANPPN